MPKYSVSSMFFHEYMISELFDYVSEAGCSSIEFWLETPDFWLNGLPVKKLTDIIEKHSNLRPITIHSPVLDLNPCSVNPDVAEVSIQSTEKAVMIAEDIKADLITIHPGRRTAKRPASERDIERLYKYLHRIKKIQERKKIKVAIENMQPKVNALLFSPEKMEELLNDEKWLYFTFDIAHAIQKSEKDALNFIDLFFDRIENIHVSGTDGENTHTTPRKCKETIKILKYLANCGYNKNLTLEIEDMNFKRHLTIREKIVLISEETQFVKNIFEV